MDKILKIQSEIGVLVKTETNPFFKSKYMDINGLLEQLLPLLEKHGLTVIQPLSHIDGKPALKTIVIDSSNIKDSVLVEEIIPLPDLQDPQKMGSAITYYRRYALQSLFLLRAEDDDANNARKTPETASRSVEKPKEVSLYEMAIYDIKNEEDIFGLNNIKNRVLKSPKFTDKEKETLTFIITEKIDSVDPTK